MDLVRKILVATADARQPLEASVFADERHDYQEVAYHFRIMEQAGLVAASLVPGDNGYYHAAVESLTWEGQDFLSAVANDGVWRKVSMKIAKIAGDATLDVTKALAVKELGNLLMQ